MYEYMILEDYKIEKSSIMSKTVYGMSCRAIIIFPVWSYPPKKKKGVSAGGDSGICGISVSIEKCSTSSC